MSIRSCRRKQCTWLLRVSPEQQDTAQETGCPSHCGYGTFRVPHFPGKALMYLGESREDAIAGGQRRLTGAEKSRGGEAGGGRSGVCKTRRASPQHPTAATASVRTSDEPRSAPNGHNPATSLSGWTLRAACGVGGCRV
jgi:hypothetical protein